MKCWLYQLVLGAAVLLPALAQAQYPPRLTVVRTWQLDGVDYHRELLLRRALNSAMVNGVDYHRELLFRRARDNYIVDARDYHRELLLRRSQAFPSTVYVGKTYDPVQKMTTPGGVVIEERVTVHEKPPAPGRYRPAVPQQSLPVIIPSPGADPRRDDWGSGRK